VRGGKKGVPFIIMPFLEKSQGKKKKFWVVVGGGACPHILHSNHYVWERRERVVGMGGLGKKRKVK